jgi:hypothetical protein
LAPGLNSLAAGLTRLAERFRCLPPTSRSLAETFQAGGEPEKLGGEFESSWTLPENRQPNVERRLRPVALGESVPTSPVAQ